MQLKVQEKHSQHVKFLNLIYRIIASPFVIQLKHFTLGYYKVEPLIIVWMLNY